MGWTFRNLDDGGPSTSPSAKQERISYDPSHLGVYPSSAENDASRTAFGNVVKIPNDFVPPAITTSNRRKHPNLSTNPTRAYCIRATRRNASSSSANIHPVDCQSSRNQPPPLQFSRRAKAHTEPVDYVYDINVRRRLREQVDADRRNNLLKAKAREATLRAENKWVFDKRDRTPPRRKRAWQRSGPIPQVSTRNSSSSRAGSASNLSSTCHSQRHRSRVPFRDDTDDVEMSIQDFERRLQTQ